MALVCLAALAAAALAGMGWFGWLVTTRTETMARDFAKAITEMTLASDQMTTTLVHGYRDSPAPSEPSSIEQPETERLSRDEFSWDDMPAHIRDHYLREQMEDSSMATPSSTPS